MSTTMNYPLRIITMNVLRHVKPLERSTPVLGAIGLGIAAFLGIAKPAQSATFAPYMGFENQQVDARAFIDLHLMMDDLATPSYDPIIDVNVFLNGIMRIHTGTAFEDSPGSGFFVLPWSIPIMNLSGSSSLGFITTMNNPALLSTGTVSQLVPGNDFPADLTASIYRSITVPGYGELRNVSPVVINAQIGMLPPFGVEIAHVTPATLFDLQGDPRGVVAGRSITLTPVPEPTSILGSLAFGLGSLFCKKRKQSEAQS